MRRGFVFGAARVAALASLGPAAHGLPNPAVERGPSVHELEVIEFLERLWDDAWGADFVLRESGMGLTAGAGPASWTVTVYRQQDAIAAGTYDEVVRLPLPDTGGWGDVPAGAPLESSLSVTAGVLHGLDGYASPVFGLLRRVTVTGGDEPVVVEGFAPLGTTPDVVYAVQNAGWLYATIAGLSMLPGGEPYTTDPCLCRQVHDNAVAACAASAVSCELRCAALALGAVAACLGAGPFVPACMALVIAAEIACLGACVAEFEACRVRAENDRLRCVQTCVEPRP